MREKEEMRERSNKRNELVRGPSRTTWLPPWLTSSTPAADVSQKPPAGSRPASWLNPFEDPELFARWEEQTAVRLRGGKLPPNLAELHALIDVMREEAMKGPPAQKR
jgi:hypothetical protein